MKFEILHFAATTPRHCQTSLATFKPNKQNGTVEQNASISKSSDKNREVNVTLVRIVSARVQLVFWWKVGALHDVYTDFYRVLIFSCVSERVFTVFKMWKSVFDLFQAVSNCFAMISKCFEKFCGHFVSRFS